MNERMIWRALARDVLAVAVVTDGYWKAYIAAVAGKNHDDEASGVVAQGVGLDADVALAIFPRFGHLAYTP